MKEHNIQQQKKDQVSVQKEEKVESSLNRSVYYEEDDDDDEIIGDSYFDRRITTLPVYLDAKDTGLNTHVVHDKYESFTMHSLKEQLTVLNTKKGIGSNNPIETSAWNVFACGKFLATGVLYNLTHIFSWTKRQRERKKAVAKSMGQVFLRFGKNLLKTVGLTAASPVLAAYGVKKYIKNKYVEKDEFYKKESLVHTICKKAYGYLWGGIGRNILNTAAMGALLPLWLVSGVALTINRAVTEKKLQGFVSAFTLPVPKPPAEWEHYYERYSLMGALTGGFHKEKDETTGKLKTVGAKEAWRNFIQRAYEHYGRLKLSSRDEFFTEKLRQEFGFSEREHDNTGADFNNMQQI